MVGNYMAANELNRVMCMSAFNIKGYTKREKVNQHCTYYDFPDDSGLYILHTSGKGRAFSRQWEGTIADHHLAPVWLPMKINARGN